MKSLSKSAKIIAAVVLFAVLYVPVNLLWKQALPSYAGFLAGVGETAVNALEFSDTSYRVSVEQGDFKVVAHVAVGGRRSRLGEYELPGTRPTDLVTYNLSLWAALALATTVFIGPSARWRFLLIAPLIIFLWQLCDLTIFAKNTRWILVKDLNKQFPTVIDYSYSWHWLWYWAQELNRRIIDPFLPLLLWIVFCSKSFFLRPGKAAKDR